MTVAKYTERIAQAAARLKTKFVVGYYLLTVVVSAVILCWHGRLAVTADLLAALFFLVVTVLFYELSQPDPTTNSSRKEGRI